MINEQIRDKEVRLIGSDGEQLGIMSAKEAMFKAQEAGLDLVKIAPQAKPPVCKIIDYGKYRYELARKEKEAKKKQKTIDVKEVRLSPNIDTNDLNTKVNAARKFLSKGDRVKVTLRFRGREMAHMASSRHVLDDFAKQLAGAMQAAGGSLRGRGGIRYIYYQGEVKQLVESSHKEVRVERSFTILEDVNCPAVLAEQCFVTSDTDVARFGSEDGCKRTARAYYEAICAYFETTPLPEE